MKSFLSHFIKVTFSHSKLCRRSSAPNISYAPALSPPTSLDPASSLLESHTPGGLREKHTGPPRCEERVNYVSLAWKEFYTRARAIRNKGGYPAKKSLPGFSMTVAPCQMQ